MVLDRRRLKVYPRIVLAIYLAVSGWWISGGRGLLDRRGTPVGADFVTFYGASVLAGRGDAPGAWNVPRLSAAERDVVGAAIPTYAFHYPPTFLLALLPLATVPYVWALVAWWTTSAAMFLAVVRRIAPHPLTAGLALAFPGFFQNVVQGQNGVYTASLLGAGLVLVDRRPGIGGAVLGLLSYKPQLVPLVWLALVAGRRWVALAASVATAAALVGVSVAVLGVESWRAFLANLPLAVRVLETKGAIPWFRMPTVHVAAMMLDSPVGVARLLQGVSALGAAAAVAVVWARGTSLATRAATLACATLLATPFAFDYDLAVLAIPLAFLGWSGVQSGFGRREVPVLAAAWFAPLVAPAIAGATRVSLAPLLLIAIVAVALGRERSLYNSSSALQAPHA